MDTGKEIQPLRSPEASLVVEGLNQPGLLRDRAKFWRDPQLGNLELLRATYVTHVFAPHAHEGYAIGVIEKGVQVSAFHRNNVLMPAGSVAAINPGAAHTGHAADEQGWVYRMVYPDASILQRAAAEIAGRELGLPLFPVPVIHDRYLARLLHDMHVALEDDTTPALERESRLLWTLAQLIVRHSADRPVVHEARPERACVHQAREYLGERYAENVSLEELASHVHLSRFHLLRVFKAEVGLPPHAYLNNVRIMHAKELLSAGTPIADVAQQTGFADQSHLTRQFKRVVGITPGQYRRVRS